MAKIFKMGLHYYNYKTSRNCLIELSWRMPIKPTIDENNTNPVKY